MKIEIANSITSGQRLRSRVQRHKIEFSLLIVFLVVCAIYFIGNFTVFTSFDIYYSFMSTIPFFGIMAIFMTFVVTLGEMDLSFPSVLAFSSWILGTVFVLTQNVWLAVLSCLAVGAIAGLINSIFIVKIGIPSLVATIGMQFLFRGLVNVCASGTGISLVEASDTFLYKILVGRLFGVIPAQALWMVGLAVLCWFIFNKHRFGLHVSFVGDNKDSAIMMGINVNRVKTIVFVMMGLATAFCGVLSNFEVTYFWPSQGTGYMLTTLAAVFVGGTSVFGGKGSIVGTFLACLIIGSLEAGIIAIGINGFWIKAMYGLIMLVSVTIYAVMMKKTR